MRSIAFFTVVCGSLLLILYLVVERDEPLPTMLSESITETGNSPQDDADDAKGNVIAFVHYDSEKGRPAYEFEGRFEDAFQSIQNPGHWVLHDGKLTIPIYDENEGADAEEAEPSQVVFTFAHAEYRAQDGGSIKGDGVITLTGGGEGISDDGTRIHFQDLRIDIRKIFEDDKSKNVYLIRTDNPVQITHELLSIESPAGMEGQLRDKDKLQHLTFHPPVRTYLDARAASLFGLKVREPASGAPGPKESATEKADSRVPTKLAITCSGPLILDRTVEPHRIEFRDDVRIYQIEKPTPGENPPLGDRWFHCQAFTMEFARTAGDGGAQNRLTISQAEATWAGDRVKARYGDLRFDAEKLIWKQLGRDPKSAGAKKILSEAVLTGSPHFESEGSFELRSRSAVLRLDENRFVLRDDVRGTFHIPDRFRDGGTSSDRSMRTGPKKAGTKSEGQAEEKPKKRFGLPESLDFRASGVEIVLHDRDDEKSRAAKSDEKQDEGPGKLLPALRGVSRLLAYSDDDQGLVLESPGGEFELRGRLLTYDAASGQMLLEGGTNLPPRFNHSRGNGSAREIALLLNENILRFRDRVFMDVQVGSVGADAREDADDDDVVSKKKPSAPSEPEKTSPKQAEAIRIVGEQVDVKFVIEETAASGRTDVAIHSIEARTLGKRPVTLTPLSDSSAASFKIEGPNLIWNQEQEIAVMKTLDPDELIGAPTRGLLSRPNLIFEGGILETDHLEFDRKRWTADLTGKVVIRGTLGQSTAAATRGQGTSPRQHQSVIECQRAQIKFFDDFAPLPVERESNELLRRIRSIHAWGGDQPISIVRDAYSARAQEASWDSETQQLRLFGEGLQEFQRNKSDTLLAEEIVYRRSEGLLQLRRNVSGQILLEHRVTPQRESGARAGPPAPTARSPRPLVWKFRCPTVDAYLREVNGTLQLDRLIARDDVFLACEGEGIQLHGDDLEYLHADQEIRIFSQHGRYQTLTNTRKDVQNGEIVVWTNKVDSREIRVWYKGYTPPNASPGTRIDHVVVRFDRDVNAAFYAPVPAAGVVHSSVLPGERDELKLWKLRANRLTMRLTMRGSSGGELPYAYAEGEIDFSSDDMRAMASEAIFEKPANRLTLRGDSKNPVRLYYKGRTLQKSEVILMQIGKTFRVISK